MWYLGTWGGALPCGVAQTALLSLYNANSANDQTVNTITPKEDSTQENPKKTTSESTA